MVRRAVGGACPPAEAVTGDRSTLASGSHSRRGLSRHVDGRHPLFRVSAHAPTHPQASRSFGAIARALRSHPDALCLFPIIAVAIFFRAEFVFRAPMFMQHDSLGYFLPAYELATGEGFGVGFRRTPLYPLFLSGALVTLGEGLAGILILQHALGVATAGTAYWLGRITFGRLVGLAGGLLAAVNGALLIAEHYLMSEPLFIPLLAAALLTLIQAGRSPRVWRYLLAGLLLGLATLCRPIAQALFPLVPLAFLLLGQRLREIARGTLLVALGIAALIVPWTVRNCLAGGECTTTSVMGQSLLARTAYYDHGFVYFDSRDPRRGAEAPNAAVRRFIQRASEKNSSGGVIARGLQAEFNWTDAETARYTREMALDAIRHQPLYYASGTLQMFWRIFGGEYDRLRTDWKTQGRRLNREEWDERVQHLLANPTPEQRAEFDRAEALVTFWQPVYWRPWLPLLAVVGLTASLLSGGVVRGAAILGLASLLLMLAAAAFNGPVPRYRYPVDPLLGLLAAGGALTLVRLGSRLPRLASRVMTTKHQLRRAPGAAPEAGLPGHETV
jgi:4-amino-4-deoxy-L-arabinose transferase-like glycosyltransferase